jgi:hypothetical protein
VGVKCEKCKWREVHRVKLAGSVNSGASRKCEEWSGRKCEEFMLNGAMRSGAGGKYVKWNWREVWKVTGEECGTADLALKGGLVLRRVRCRVSGVGRLGPPTLVSWERTPPHSPGLLGRARLGSVWRRTAQ